MPRALLRPADVAVYLGQSVEWARRSMADGTLPGARKVRGRWLVALEDVDRWVDAGRPERQAPEGPAYAPFPEVMSRTVDRVV